jgi:hypothetical protein
LAFWVTAPPPIPICLFPPVAFYAFYIFSSVPERRTETDFSSDGGGRFYSDGVE